MSVSRWLSPILIGSTLAFAAVAGASELPDGAYGATRLEADANATVAVEIPEVGCAGCSLQIRKALKAAGGVVRLAEGDPKNRLLVTYEPGPSRPDVYVDALRKAGFPKAHRVPD